MALDVQDIKATILAALREHKDNQNVSKAIARRYFNRHNINLDLPYRSNGETAREILEKLEAYEEAADKAIFYVESEL